MELSSQDTKYINEFFASLEGIVAASGASTLSLVAINNGQQHVVVRARVFLVAGPVAAPFQFTSQHVSAVAYSLCDLNLNPRQLLDQLMTGELKVDGQTYHFPPGHGGTYSPYHVPFHPDGLTDQRRLAALTLSGADIPSINLTEIDWEIRATEIPYNGISEILGLLRLPPLTAGPCTVEFVRQNVAQIDTSVTTVNGTTAEIAVRVAPGLDRQKFRLSYRVQDKLGNVPMRGTIPASDLTWTKDDPYDHFTAKLEVPLAAVVNAIVSYNNVAQHYWWFADPATSQNPRRAAYHAFDPNLAIIREVIEKAHGKNPEARTFEAAVGWIFWMLGFSGTHIGAMDKMSEVPDHLVTTPSGSHLVVECTTRLLKAESKLANLHDRTEAVRRALIASDHGHQKVIPVIITTKTRAEVAVDLDLAEQMGVHVITRDDFEDILTQTLLVPTPDTMFSQIEQQVLAAKAKHLPFVA